MPDAEVIFSCVAGYCYPQEETTYTTYFRFMHRWELFWVGLFSPAASEEWQVVDSIYCSAYFNFALSDLLQN